MSSYVILKCSHSFAKISQTLINQLPRIQLVNMWIVMLTGRKSHEHDFWQPEAVVKVFLRINLIRIGFFL